MKQFLILEWTGHWRPSDPYHGGVNPGPHATEGDAQHEILVHAEKEWRAQEENGRSSRFCYESKLLILNRHAIISVEWPADPAPLDTPTKT